MVLGMRLNRRWRGSGSLAPAIDVAIKVDVAAGERAGGVGGDPQRTFAPTKGSCIFWR